MYYILLNLKHYIIIIFNDTECHDIDTNKPIFIFHVMTNNQKRLILKFYNILQSFKFLPHIHVKI